VNKLQKEIDELVELVTRLMQIRELESRKAKEALALCEKETKRIVKECNKLVKFKDKKPTKKS
jgi:hypothetical protein